MLQKLDNPLDSCELKFESDKGEFKGYASVFNKVDAVRDTILPGAYAETLKNDRSPAMFVNHDSWSVPIGDWVKLKEDKKGLLVTGLIDMNHKDGPTVFSALKRQAMSGLSIGFRIPAGGAEDREDGARFISKIDLKEISIVNFPADDHARISAVKSDIETLQNLKDVEQFLRDSGFSRSAAQVLVSRVLKLNQSDSETELKNEIARLNSKLQSTNVTNQLVETIGKL